MKLKTEFTFDSAHRLRGYDGKCSQLHGHIWRVEMEIEGETLDTNGILWDFTNTKKLKEMLDHKTILNCFDIELETVIKKVCGTDSVIILPWNPTAEHLANFIWDKCKIDNSELKFKIKVYESPKSYAEVEG